MAAPVITVEFGTIHHYSSQDENSEACSFSLFFFFFFSLFSFWTDARFNWTLYKLWHLWFRINQPHSILCMLNKIDDFFMFRICKLAITLHDKQSSTQNKNVEILSNALLTSHMYTLKCDLLSFPQHLLKRPRTDTQCFLAILIPTLHASKWAVRPWLSSYPSQAYEYGKISLQDRYFLTLCLLLVTPLMFYNYLGYHGNLTRPSANATLPLCDCLCHSRRGFFFLHLFSSFKDLKIATFLKMIVLF